MAEMDMGLSPNNNKKRKKKKKQSFGKSLVSALIPCKGDDKAEVARKVIFLASLCVLIVAVIAIALILYPLLFGGDSDMPSGTQSGIFDGNSAVQEGEQVLVNPQAPTKEQIDNLPDGSINEEYAAYYEENNDFVGWITINGTNVDYPVVQGDDNEFYLHHNFYGQDEFAGTIFTDFEGRFGPDEMPNNTILYGHNMLYKYKFSALNNYNNNIQFLKETPVVEFNTLYQKNKYKILSVFIINTDEEHGEVFDYTKYVYFKNSDEFYNYIMEIMDRSKYNTGVDVEYGDELLTLSTCDGTTGFDNMRLVIVARRVRENESPDVDTSKITRKESIKYFEAYTNVYGNKWKGRTWDISLVKGMKEYLEENGLMDEPENY